MSESIFRKGSVRFVVCTLLVAVCLGPVTQAFADTAAQKAVRGLANMGCGIVALPGEIYSHWRQDGAAIGWSTGLGIGLGMVMARTMVGVFELCTSPAPWPKSNFAPLIEPHPTCMYLLFHPRRGPMWLSDYRGRFTLTRTTHVMPVESALDRKRGAVLQTHDKRKWVCQETGVYRLDYVDGALPWLARKGDVVAYAEFVDAPGKGTSTSWNTLPAKSSLPKVHASAWTGSARPRANPAFTRNWATGSTKTRPLYASGFSGSWLSAWRPSSSTDCSP